MCRYVYNEVGAILIRKVENKPWVAMDILCDNADRRLFAVATSISLGNEKKCKVWTSAWLNGTSPQESTRRSSAFPSVKINYLCSALGQPLDRGHQHAGRNLSWASPPIYRPLGKSQPNHFGHIHHGWDHLEPNLLGGIHSEIGLWFAIPLINDNWIQKPHLENLNTP